MPNQPSEAPELRFTAQLTGLDYALPGTLARRFMLHSRQDELPMQGRPSNPARALPALDPHRRRQNRHPQPDPRPSGPPLPSLVRQRPPDPRPPQRAPGPVPTRLRRRRGVTL